MLLSRNIFLLYLIKISGWFMVYMPVVKLFYQENGLSNADLFLLHGFYSVTIALMEIPSGYLADVFGRRFSMVLGGLFTTAGFAAYALGEGVGLFLVAELLLGLGSGFISGADSAMLYDTLKEQGREHRYLKYEGYSSGFGNFAEAGAALVGGGLAVWLGTRAVYQVQVLIALVGFAAAFFLINPAIHQSVKRPKLKDVVDTMRFVFTPGPLLTNTLLSSFIGLGTLSMAWFAQIYYTGLPVPVGYYGIIWAVLNLAPGITSVLAYRVRTRLSERLTIIVIVTIVSLGFFALALSHWYAGLAVLLVFYLARGVATPLLKDNINRLIGPEVRATVLSVRSLVIRVLFAALGPVFGWVADKVSLSIALFFAGSVIGTGAFIVLWYYLKQTKQAL